MPELLSGSLRAVGLPSLLQLAETEGLSGRLALHGAGEVQLRDGLPVAARCEGLEARAALMELFLVDVDRFSLHAVEVLPDGAPLGEVLELVMEGCRLADEWSRLAPCPITTAPADPVPGAAGALLAALDAGQPLERGRRAAGLARAACVDPILDLVEQGRLRLGAPLPLPADPPAPSPAPAPGLPQPQSPPVAPAAAPLDYFTALERGRAQLRDRDHDGAEASFQAALAARPDDRVARQNLARARQLRQQDQDPSSARAAAGPRKAR